MQINLVKGALIHLLIEPCEDIRQYVLPLEKACYFLGINIMDINPIRTMGRKLISVGLN